MKLRYLFSIILSALFFAGCADLSTDSFDNIKLDKTFVMLSVEGGTAELRVNATEAWKIDTTYTKDVWPNVIKRAKDKVTVESCEPSWLSADVMEGGAGETVIKFSAAAIDGGRELELCIKAGANSQFVKIRQGSLAASVATCAEIIAGPDGKTYRVTGTVQNITNTLYGNWDLVDETGKVLIYGTLDKDGKTKNFESLGLEAGDVVEVEGPKLTYGTKVELVDVTVLSIKKSLLKIVTEEELQEPEGGEIEVKVAFKGDGLYPVIAEDAKSWLSISGVTTDKGIPTKIEPNPADTAYVKITIAENPEFDIRNGIVSFSSSKMNDDKKLDVTEMDFTISQKGQPRPSLPTIAEVIAAGPAAMAETEGVIVATYTRGALISDGTGYILIYKGSAIEEVVGDKVKVSGATSEYGGMLQFGASPTVTKVSSGNEVTHPTPTVLDGAGMDAQLEKKAVEYVEYTGTLDISDDGRYFNVAVEGATKAQGSLQYLDVAAHPAAVDGAKITVRGYFIGVSLGKYVNTMTVEVK